MKTLSTIRGLLNMQGQRACNVLRVAAACGEGETVTIGANVFEVDSDGSITTGHIAIDLSAAASFIRALGTLSQLANPANTETVTIGSTVYTFKTALSSGPTVAYEVLVGADAEATIANLIAAIGAGSGLGTTYSTGTLVHPSVTAALGTNVAATGTLTSDNTNVVTGATVTIGTKVYTFKDALTPTEGEVLVSVTNADGSLLNLINAINHTGTPGTDYSCAAVHPTVTAAASVTSHAFLITAKVAGAAANLVATTETSSHLSFGAVTLTGGITKVTVTAKAKGTGGNAIATTETLGSGSFGGSTLASGADASAADFIAGFVIAVNASIPVIAESVVAGEVFCACSQVGQNALAATETLAGSGNVWAAATFFGGQAPPDSGKGSALISRVPTATEITLQTMHFAFPFTVAASTAILRDSTGVNRVYDGKVVNSGNRVSLLATGSTDPAANDVVTVLASA